MFLWPVADADKHIVHQIVMLISNRTLNLCWVPRCFLTPSIFSGCSPWISCVPAPSHPANASPNLPHYRRAFWVWLWLLYLRRGQSVRPGGALVLLGNKGTRQPQDVDALQGWYSWGKQDYLFHLWADFTLYVTHGCVSPLHICHSTHSMQQIK